MVGFSSSSIECFWWDPPEILSALPKILNLTTTSSKLLSVLWNLTFVLVLSSRTSFMSWFMSFIITFHSTWVFRRFSTSSNTSSKIYDNEVGPMGSQYSSTTFQYLNGIPSYYSVPHDHTNAYNYSIFSGLVISPPPVVKISMSFFFLSDTFLYVFIIIPYPFNFNIVLTSPWWWHGIWSLWITIYFSSTILYIMLLSYVLFGVSGILSGMGNSN